MVRPPGVLPRTVTLSVHASPVVKSSWDLLREQLWETAEQKNTIKGKSLVGMLEWILKWRRKWIFIARERWERDWRTPNVFWDPSTNTRFRGGLNHLWPQSFVSENLCVVWCTYDGPPTEFIQHPILLSQTDSQWRQLNNHTIWNIKYAIALLKFINTYIYANVNKCIMFVSHPLNTIIQG